MNLPEGHIIADKYRVERVLGAGGMGVVVVAMHLHLEERVAIKFLLPEIAQNGEAVARFMREAQVAAKLKGEHVARVIDVALLPDRTPYLVMEYLVGSDLGDRVKQRGPVEGSEVAGYMLEVCEALAEAHALGIVHRDIKPANLFLAQRSDGTACVKILDFGISKFSKGASSGMTRTTAVMGSPYYMSPEQLKSSRDVDARADIWALGVTLFELLTGRLPFEADDMPQLCTMILYSEPQGLRDLKPNLTSEWQAIVNRCLAKDREQRYANVAELAHDLVALAPSGSERSFERVARFLGTSQRSSALPAPRSAPAQVTTATFGKTQDPAPSRKGPLLAVAAAFVIALLVGGWLLLRTNAQAPEAETSASATAHAAVVSAVPPAAPPAAEPPVAPALLPAVEPSVPTPPPSATVAAVKPKAAPRARPAAPAERAPAPAAAAPAPAPIRKPASALPDGLD